MAQLGPITNLWARETQEQERAVQRRSILLELLLEVRRTIDNYLRPSSRIFSVRPWRGRHSRGMPPRATIRTRLSAGIPRLVFHIVVEIRGARYCYWALVGSGLIRRLGKQARKLLSGQTCAIISDTNILQLVDA